MRGKKWMCDSCNYTKAKESCASFATASPTENAEETRCKCPVKMRKALSYRIWFHLPSQTSTGHLEIHHAKGGRTLDLYNELKSFITMIVISHFPHRVCNTIFYTWDHYSSELSVDKMRNSKLWEKYMWCNIFLILLFQLSYCLLSSPAKDF